MSIPIKEDTLRSFISTQDTSFENIYAMIANTQKSYCRSLLTYLHLVLNEYTNRPIEKGIRFSHLHFSLLEEFFKEIILEYVTIRYFCQGLLTDRSQDTFIPEKILHLERKLNNVQIPDGASGFKGNREYKRWKAGRKEINQTLKFLKNPMISGKSFLTQTIINIYAKDSYSITQRSQSEWYSINLEDLLSGNKRSYILLNPDKPNDDMIAALNEVDAHKYIKNVILFDCENRKLFQGFNKRYLEELIEYGIPIQDLILFTFERSDLRLRRTVNKYHQIYSNYYFLPRDSNFEQSYFFIKEEKDLLCDKHSDSKRSIDWIGGQYETFYDYLVLIKDFGVDKLRSIPILNIYSFCFTKKIAELILNDFFYGKTGDTILDSETRFLLNNLESDERDQLKQCISLILDLVVQQWEKMKETIIKIGKNRPIGIVIPHQVVNNSLIQNEFKRNFPDLAFNFYTWNNIKEDDIKEKTIIILAYRDTGVPPFDIYPNIVENQIQEDRSLHMLFMKMFFFERYKSNTYRYFTTYNGLLANPLRYRALEWKKIDQYIEDMRTTGGDYLVESDDIDYGIGSQSESIRIEFTDLSHTSLYPSKLLVGQKQGIGKYLVMRPDELLESPEVSEYYVQPLEDLYKELNLFEITPAEEDELKQIKQRYGIVGKDQKYALWKFELNKKLDQNGGDPMRLYEIIKTVTGNDGKLIKYSYFRDYWLDIKSELIIPRRTKHFRQICNYLGLPFAYYRLKLKQRASLRASSRQSNSQMNYLIAHMINEGLFDDTTKWQSIDITALLEEHDLEEKGIVYENAQKELQVLIDLIKGEMDLKQILNIKIS